MSLNLDRSLRQELLRRRSKTDNEFNPSTSIKDNQPTIKRDGTMNTIKILVEAYGKSSYGDHRALAPHCQSMLPQELASSIPKSGITTTLILIETTIERWHRTATINTATRVGL